ncbi:MAG: PAS domain S-box protein [Fulvivirga sp.]
MTKKTKKDSTPNFEDIVESLSDMIYELDEKERFYYANSMLERLSGYSKEELKKLHFTDLVKKSQIKNLQDFYIKQRLEQISDTYYEFIMVSKSGKEIWVGQNVKMLFKPDGKVKFVRSVARDITHLRKLRLQSEQRAKKLEKSIQEQKEVRKDLEEKNRLMDLILNTMTDSVVVLNAEGEFILFNEASEAIAGKGSTDRSSDEWTEHYGLYYPDKKTLIPTEELPMLLSLQGKEVHNFESYIKNDENTGVFVRVNTRPLRDDDGSILGALVVSTNINDQKEYENRLRASEEKFRAISDASPLGIFVTDQEGACEYTNAEYQKLSGLSFEEALGTGWANAIHEEDRDRVFKEWNKSVENQVMFKTEQRFKQKNGKVVWTNVKAAAMTINDKVVGYVGTVEDITESKKNHEALLQAKELAEKASKAKEDFLSTMSHEIRTPLNAVIGMAYLLQDESPQEHQIENLNALRFSADNLLVLINDILDYNKIESGKVAFEKVEVDLKKLITRIRQSL